jgi:hypothetical protein
MKSTSELREEVQRVFLRVKGYEEEREVMRPGVCTILRQKASSLTQSQRYEHQRILSQHILACSGVVSHSISWVAQSSHGDGASLGAKE